MVFQLISSLYHHHLRDTMDHLLAGGAYLISRTLTRAEPVNLAHLDSVERLSPIVVRVLGQNPGPFTLQGTNTYLVGTGKRRILVDTGEGLSAYGAVLKRALDGGGLSCIIATHWHNDHVGGIQQVLREVCSSGNDLPPVYKFRRGGSEKDEHAELYEYVDDGYEVQTEGATLRLIHTPGHTSDHMSVYLLEEKSLFSGDCVLGEGSAIFENLHSYMASLDIMLKLHPSRIYPGHGAVIDETPMDKLHEYVRHRLQRESEVLEALRELCSATPMAITSKIYKDIPLTLKFAAMGNVKHHLEKLITDGRVREVSAGVYALL